MRLTGSMLGRERKARGLTLAELGRRIGLSAPQLQRLEAGKRRLTLDVLYAYCEALDMDIASLLEGEIFIPVIGVIDSDSNVLPMPPNSPHQIRAPRIVPDPHNLAAVRWEPRGRIDLMHGHHMFFRRNVEGVSPAAIGRRSLIRLADGSQRIGWIIERGNQRHVDDVTGTGVFDADIIWASKILAVMPPPE